MAAKSDVVDFIPYEGRERYCFISYAHKDTEQVFPILRELVERGYRLWYDDGIAPGSEWPEYIAEHLSRSAVVVAFISPESAASANCRREITFALSKNKPFIGIFLCETEMSPGMEMQLSAQQCIMKYQIRDEELFLNKLCGTDIFAVCRMESEQAEAVVMSGREMPGADALDADDMAAVERMKAAVKSEELTAAAGESAMKPAGTEAPEGARGEPASDVKASVEQEFAYPKKKKSAGRTLLLIPVIIIGGIIASLIFFTILGNIIGTIF